MPHNKSMILNGKCTTTDEVDNKEESHGDDPCLQRTGRYFESLPIRQFGGMGEVGDLKFIVEIVQCLTYKG